MALKAWYKLRIAMDLSAGSVGANRLARRIASLPRRPCTSIGNGVHVMFGYLRLLPLAATAAAAPSLEAERLAYASADVASTMVTSM